MGVIRPSNTIIKTFPKCTRKTNSKKKKKKKKKTKSGHIALFRHRLNSVPVHALQKGALRY